MYLKCSSSYPHGGFWYHSVIERLVKYPEKSTLIPLSEKDHQKRTYILDIAKKLL